MLRIGLFALFFVVATSVQAAPAAVVARAGEVLVRAAGGRIAGVGRAGVVILAVGGRAVDALAGLRMTGLDAVARVAVVVVDDERPTTVAVGAHVVVGADVVVVAAAGRSALDTPIQNARRHPAPNASRGARGGGCRI